MTGFDFQPELEGTLIRMRPYREADWDALFEAASDPLIWDLHPVSNRWQEPVFRFNIDDALTDKGGLVAIDRPSGAIIGYSRYSQRACESDEVEIGWSFLTRAYWGGAYNRDMKRIMLAHALASFPQVIFQVGEGNWRSRAAMAKIGGMLLERTKVVTVFGRDIRHVIFAITRESFATGPLAQ